MRLSKDTLFKTNLHTVEEVRFKYKFNKFRERELRKSVVHLINFKNAKSCGMFLPVMLQADSASSVAMGRIGSDAAAECKHTSSSHVDSDMSAVKIAALYTV